MLDFINNLTRSMFGGRLEKNESRMAPRYKIVKHPEWGYCAFYDESPSPRFGHWWGPINDDITVSYEDAHLAAFNRGEFWVATKEEAGQRINRHATNDGMEEIWRG